MIQGIEHTAIAANDIGTLALWYVDVLGFVINIQSENAIFVKAPNGTMIELIRANSGRGEQTMKTQGIRHMALTVTDFDTAYARLREKNVSFVTEPEDRNGNKVVFF